MISGYNSQVTGQTAHYKDSKKLLTQLYSYYTIYLTFRYTVTDLWVCYLNSLCQLSTIFCTCLFFPKNRALWVLLCGYEISKWLRSHKIRPIR